MDSKFATNRFDPKDRNGAVATRAGNGSGAANGGGKNGNGNGNGHGANGQGANGHGGVRDRQAPAHAPIGASAVVRPVPGGEHKGMLQLVDFTQPANGTVSRNADQTLTFRPKPGFTGKDSFDYILRDEAGTTFSATVTVAVTLDAPAVKPAPARARSPQGLGALPLSPRINAGEGLPPLHGGSAPFPGE